MISDTAIGGAAIILFIFEIINFNKYLKEEKTKKIGWKTFGFIIITLIISMLLSILIFGIIIPRSSYIAGIWTWYLTPIVAGIWLFLKKKIKLV